MSINFEYYKIFYYVAKYRNITQAANLLYSSQPSVSRMIRMLENELGCILFVRTKKGVLLTPEGEELYSHIAPACEEIFAGEEMLTRSCGLQGDTIRICASETALRCFLFERLEHFYTDHPAVKLKIYNHAATEAIEALHSGNVDFAVVCTPVEVQPPMKVTQLVPFQETLIGGLQYQYLKDQTLSLWELHKYPLIFLAKGTRTRFFYEQFFGKHNLTLNPDIEVETSDLILPGVIRNLGLGFLPKVFAKQALENRKVFELPLLEEIPRRHVCLVVDTSKQLSLTARLLVKFLTGDGIQNSSEH